MRCPRPETKVKVYSFSSSSGESRVKPYLVEEVGWEIDINKETRLHRVVDLCREKFGAEVVGYAVWNIVTIWKEVRGELTGADLRGMARGASIWERYSMARGCMKRISCRILKWISEYKINY
jgi:hypothetical protein